MPSNLVFWQRYKALGYDAASSRSVLRHFLHAWYYWHEFSSAKSHRRFCASASALARRATWIATMDGTDSALCTIMAAMQDPAPLAPASACPQSSSTSATPSSLILSRIRPQILAGEVGVTAGTRTGSLLARPQEGAATQTLRGVGGSQSCSSPGALQARSRSAVAPDMTEQHSPGGHMANSVL